MFMRQARLFGEEPGEWVEGKVKPSTKGTHPEPSRSYKGPPAEPQMLASNGFLDGSYFTRTAMVAGTARGQLVVRDGDVAYGVQAFEAGSRNAHFYPGKENYRFFAAKVVAPKDPWALYSFKNVGTSKFDAL